MSVFVGCDLGTMGTKAAVVDLSGAILGEAFEEVALRHPKPGWVEQDLVEIEESAHRTIRRALAASGRAASGRAASGRAASGRAASGRAASGRAADVAGVAFSGQMSGIGTIDADFQPATHFDSWLDARCTPYIDEMAAHAARVVALSGCPPTYSHGPKIVWWQRERPDEFKRVERFLVPGAFVAGRLCGLSVADAFIDRTYLHFSNLSDTAAGRWSGELLDQFGVDPRVLPRIVDPLDVIGEVTREAAEATGLPAGTPVAAGAGDQPAASLGAGVVETGQAFDSAGTASVFAVCVDGFRPDTADLTLVCGHSVVAGRYIAMSFINGGGLALRWFRDEIAGMRDGGAAAYADLDTLAAAVEPGSGGLLWFPHFQGGVLPPQPQARGAWVGLTAGHERGHLFRSLLEGIAYEYALWADLVRATGQELHDARALGGGATSALWNGIKADVLGIDWVPTVRPECGVLGDALIAAAATGHVSDLAATARAWQRTADPVRPDPDRHATYRALRSAYEQLRTQLAPVFPALGAAAGR